MKSEPHDVDVKITSNQIYQHFVTAAQITQAIRSVARKRELNGNPFAEVRGCGTLNEQLLSIDISSAIPDKLKREAPNLVNQMAKAVVRSSTEGQAE